MKISPFHIYDKLIDWTFSKCGLSLKTKKLGKYNVEFWIGNNELPPLLLLHAFGPNAKYSWYKQVRILSKNYNLLIPNLIYFGNSSMHPKSYKVSDQVEMIKLLLIDLNINTLSIGGTSYGGLVACEFALLNEFQIDKFFISNCPVKYSIEDGWNTILKKMEVTKKSEVLVPIDYKKLYILYNISRYKLSVFPKFVFNDIHKNLYIYQCDDRRKLMDDFMGNQHLLNEHIYNFSFPILLLWGEEDDLSPIELGIKLNEHIGDNAELKVISNSGHMPNIERPFTFNALMMKFLIE